LKGIDMSKFSIFHIPLLSFYSTELYRDMALKKKGIGFGYLLLLLAFCWLFIVFSIDSQYDSFIDDAAPDMLSQFPDITIIDGQASIVESQPYFIRDPESGANIAVIDTTGTVTSLDETEAVVLLTRTHVMFKKNEIETRTFDLSEVGNIVIDRELLSTWVGASKSYLPVVIYPFALAGSFFYRIIQVLIYALIGLIFASICKTELGFDQLLRLSVVAITPGIIINTFLWTFSINLPFSGFMFFILAMVYLFLGVKSTIGHEQEEVIS